MTKKIIFSLVLSLIVLFSFFLYKHYYTSTGYNIVMIVSDSLRVDVIGCYGGHVKTPNIDWLAKQGMLFERAYSISPWTTPSSVAMFTGEYPGIYRSGMMKIKKNPPRPRYYVPDNDLLLPKYLKGIGYDVMNDVQNPFAHTYNIMQGFRKAKTYNELTKHEKKYVEDITGITPKSHFYRCMYGFLNNLLSTSMNQPFFFLKWITDPHAPYNPPEEFKEKIDIDLSKLSKKAQFYFKMPSFKDSSIMWGWTNHEKSYLKKLYEKEVESVDERIGFIISALKQKDLFKNTFVIFTSDHGEEFGEHGKWGHGKDYYETLVHIPLIICGPGIPKGKKEKTVVSHLGLMATLKDLLQLKYQDNIQGKSYSFLLTGNPIESLFYKIINGNSVYFGVGDKLNNSFQDALLDNNYKLILKKHNIYDLDLYNLADDSGESNDISEKNPELVNKMLKKVATIRKEKKKRKGFLKKISKEEKGDIKVNKETIEHLKALGYIE